MPTLGTKVLPGVGLCSLVVALALAAHFLALNITGSGWLDPLVGAIAIGTLIRSVFTLPAFFIPGVHFAAKQLLEVAIVLLGASISLQVIAGIGAVLAASVAGIVVLSLVGSYAIGRLVGLPDQLATLVACGNSICGNSAIIAAAPAINAHAEDIAAAIAFTAALGIVVVLTLPMLPGLMDLNEAQYGILAGMTVYAVPQVMAATAPVGLVSTQIGTIVKLMRVLMLGPVVLILGLKTGKCGQRLPFVKLVPWFIIGFLAMMILRSMGLIPELLQAPVSQACRWLTLLSMAALGLCVDVRSVFSSGGRVLAAGALSILFLASVTAVLVLFLPVAS